MIITGDEILKYWRSGEIMIDPFTSDRLEPNSYGFRLGQDLKVYDDPILDSAKKSDSSSFNITDDGFLLMPDTLYLGHTHEKIGSPNFAMTLYGNRSTAAMGIWIQHSAPLGHIGSFGVWTLEIRVTQPVRIYREMTIGKIAFWCAVGKPSPYVGKYPASGRPVPSRISEEFLGGSGQKGGG